MKGSGSALCVLRAAFVSESRVMKSPFPGLDPFIEARGGLWKDFHDDLISGIKHRLAPLLPEHYVVRTGERSYVERIDVERPNRFVIMEALLDAEAREVFLEIYELHPERRLVTAIEVLSPPTNAPAPLAGGSTVANARPCSAAR